MAAEETAIVNSIVIGSSKAGARLFKNVRGMFYAKYEVVALIEAAKSLNLKRIMESIKKLRQIRAGLQAAGASDLIGFIPVTVTADMVGTTLAVFCAIEVKTESGAASEEQLNFVNFVCKNGGFSGIARSMDDAKKIMKLPVD